MSTSKYDKAYVFANINTKQLLVGEIQTKGAAGSFRYSESWLNDSASFPLDPVNLPLLSRHFHVANDHGLFGVFRDAAPDDWGTKVMLLSHTHQPNNELERLLRTSGNGVGCLQFSLSRASCKPHENLPSFTLLDKLTQTIQRIEEKESLKPEELALIEHGSSLGGARPKVSVERDGSAWLLKFSKHSDFVNVPQLEYLSMRFCREHLGLNIPDVEYFELGPNAGVFGIKRFDIESNKSRHFVSANSLFNVGKARIIRDSRRNPYSYINLASILRKHSSDFKKNCHELFSRMVVNILLGNTDDHARNHAMIFTPESNAWSLSPAYDILPTVSYTNSTKQSLGIGIEGADSTLANALSCSEMFLLKKGVAQEKIYELKLLCESFPDFCSSEGMNDQDLSLVEKTIDR